MAKFRCECGNVTHDDDPAHGLATFTWGEYEDDDVVDQPDQPDLMGRRNQVIDCSERGRLWVWWNRDFLTAPVEHVR